jgi:hypothetical protein
MNITIEKFEESKSCKSKGRKKGSDSNDSIENVTKTKNKEVTHERSKQIRGKVKNSRGV